MDLVAGCKDKMTYFRIKDLKDILGQLGLSKQGKKQDLVDRILAILSDDQGIWAKKNTVSKEKVTKLIEDTFRKIQGHGSAEFVSKLEIVSECTSTKHEVEMENSVLLEKIRCLCGSTLQTDSMIKCEDPSCNVWQHIACVLIPERPMENVLPNIPDVFYCEICRLTRADPFWMTISHPLLPVKLSVTSIPADGSNPSQSVEKTFQLTRAQRDLVTKQEYDVQAWCMLLNDKVTFRMHWPQYADLQVNGLPVRAINRPGSQLLGANGRDDGPIITQCTRDGINKIFLGGCDARTFCLGIRIVKRRTLTQILNMIPKEDEGESFEDALSRVRLCVGGGPATDNADSDSDIEVIAECVPINLRCPMSGLRMKVAGRFKGCAHMGCFDLEVFVEMSQRSRKWQCPICLKNYSLEKIIIDPYFNRITSKMRSCAEDIAEIEVKPDGSWRAKAEGSDRKSLGELGLWHFPDGRIVPITAVSTSSQLEHRPIKEEVVPDDYPALRVDFKNNQNGFLEFGDAMQSISNAYDDNFECNIQNIIPMSSSAALNGRDYEDVSVNQDPEYESIDPSALRFGNRLMPAAGGNMGADIIVLSDSEDDMDPLQSTGAGHMITVSETRSDKGGLPFSEAQNHGIPDSFYSETATDRGFDLYGAHDEDFSINVWSMPSTSQGGPGLQLFGSELDVPDTLLEMQHSNLHCGPSANGFALTQEPEMGSARIPDSAYKADVDDSLVDNPLAYHNDDPSLQIFLPTRPSDALTSHPDLRNHSDVPNGIGNEDWISLRLGDGAGVSQNEYAARGTSVFAPQQQSGTAPLDPVSDSGSLLFGSDAASGLPGLVDGRKERSESPFLFPRQRRSVRPRPGARSISWGAAA